MGTAGKVVLGLLLAGGLGAGLYFAFRKKVVVKKDEPGNMKDPATADQFELFKKTMIATGSDMFEGAGTERIAEMKSKFIKNLNQYDVVDLQRLASMKEKEWNAADKVKFVQLFQKWTGKKIVS